MRRVILFLLIFACFYSPSYAQSSHEVLYINDAGELIALAPASTAQRVLLTLQNPLDYGYGLSVSSDGNFVAVFERSNTVAANPAFHLYVINLADGQVWLDQNLLPANYAYPASETLGDPAYELTRALGEVVWSPDSRYLAFISAQGGNADAYLFEASTQALAQLTTAPTTAAFLSWNPSSTRLVFTELNSFGNGSGFQVAGYTSVEVATGQSSPLILTDPAQQAGMAIIGWLDDQSFIYAPYNFTLFGASGLYRYDLAAQTATELLPPHLALTLPVFDKLSQTVAFVVPDVSAGGLVPGAYLWQAGAPTLLQAGTFFSVQTARAGLFQFEGLEGSFLLAADNPQLVGLPAHDFGAYVSPQADAVALARSDGVYISNLTADNAVLVWADQTQVPIWSPDGSLFYSWGYLNDQAGLVEVDVVNRSARLLDSRMAVSSPRAVAP